MMRPNSAVAVLLAAAIVPVINAGIINVPDPVSIPTAAVSSWGGLRGSGVGEPP